MTKILLDISSTISTVVITKYKSHQGVVIV